MSARPAVIEESQRFTTPDPEYHFSHALAMDGNDLLVVGKTPELADDPRLAVFHYERQADGTWVFRSTVLSHTYYEYGNIFVRLKNGIAVVYGDFTGDLGRPFILEKSGTGWISSRPAVTDPADAAIHGTTIAFGARGCLCVVEKNAAGEWVTVAAFDPPPGEDWDDVLITPLVELTQNMLVAASQGMPREMQPTEYPVHVYERVQGQWTLTQAFDTGKRAEPNLIDGQIALTFGSRHEPGDIASYFTRDAQDAWTVRHSLLSEEWWADKGGGAEIFLDGRVFAGASGDSARGIAAGSITVLDRDLTAVEPRFRHVATLLGSDSVPYGRLGWPLAASGRSVATVNKAETQAGNALLIYELPEPLPAVAREQDTFQDMNAAGWTPWGTTQWQVVSSGGTHVFRQTNLQGDARAIFDGYDGENQSIQADLKVNAIATTSRPWVGLMVRYTGPYNFYYMLNGANNTLQIRKIVNGTYGPIATVPFTMQNGRRYRFRLEAVGTWLRAYVDDQLMAEVQDTSHSTGRAGIAMWKTNAEFDNVVISSSPYTTLHQDTFTTSLSDTGVPWETQSGTWTRLASEGGPAVFRQSNTSGIARAVNGAPAEDQILTADIHLSLAGPGRPGLLARYVDVNNYYHVFISPSEDKVSLRRWQNGQTTVLAEAPLNVTPGTTYRFRFEAIGTSLRLYVDGKLLVEAEDSVFPRGRYGLVTYNTAADFGDFQASRP